MDSQTIDTWLSDIKDQLLSDLDSLWVVVSTMPMHGTQSKNLFSLTIYMNQTYLITPEGRSIPYSDRLLREMLKNKHILYGYLVDIVRPTELGQDDYTSFTKLQGDLVNVLDGIV